MTSLMYDLETVSGVESFDDEYVYGENGAVSYSIKSSSFKESIMR